MRYMATFTTILVLAVAGLVTARITVPSGIDRFSAATPEHEVAKSAYFTAWGHHDNPIVRALVPALQVSDVTLRRGHCPDGRFARSPHGLGLKVQPPPTGQEPIATDLPSLQGDQRMRMDPYRDYTAIVHGYTFYGLPALSIYISCGGSRSSFSMPSWAKAKNRQGVEPNLAPDGASRRR